MSNSEKHFRCMNNGTGNWNNSKAHVNSREDLAIAYTPGVGKCKVIAKIRSRIQIYNQIQHCSSRSTEAPYLASKHRRSCRNACYGRKGRTFKELAVSMQCLICLDAQDTEEIIRTVVNIAPAFGGINLKTSLTPLF